jgi:hypothetical protein
MTYLRGRDRRIYKPPPDIMSQAQIRWWLTNLVEQHGWTAAALARTLNLRASNEVRRKGLGGDNFIWPTEHIRISHVLDRIIRGELVPRCGRAGKKDDAVIADNPKPLVTVGRIPPGDCLPSFRSLLLNPPRWREKKFEEMGG